jgi:hypothetical protein
MFDFVTPHPDFDVKGNSGICKIQRCKMIMHHETSGSTQKLRTPFDKAFQFMNDNGYEAVKKYVGPIFTNRRASQSIYH